MGVGASSNMRAVQLNPGYLPGNAPRGPRTPRSTCDRFVPDASGNMKNMVVREEDEAVSKVTKFKDLEDIFENTEEHARTLELVLASTEGSNLELSEKVLQLEDQLEAARNRAISLESHGKTIYIKDQHIQRLESEVKTAREELTMQQLQSKRKIKKLQMDLAQAKQEAALTILLLKKKLKILCEATQGHVEESASKKPSGDAEHVCEEDKRQILIQELSFQVSQQQEKINELEKMLELREVIIKQLEAERQSKHIVNAEIPLESKPIVGADMFPENQNNVDADISQECEYILDVALSQESEHIAGAEIPKKFKHNVDANSTMESKLSVVADIKKSENSMVEDITKESNYFADADFSEECNNIADPDFSQNYIVNADSIQDSPYISDAKFTLEFEYKEEAEIQQDSECFVDSDVSQHSLAKQPNEDLDGIDGDDSNEEFEIFHNQISKETSSHNGKENTTSSTQNVLSNIEGIKQMQISPKLAEKGSPSSLDINVSQEEPHNSFSEVFMFGSNAIADEERVKPEEDDLFEVPQCIPQNPHSP